MQVHAHSQYSRWLISALRGDFGKTYSSQKSVLSVCASSFPPSFELVAMSLVFSVFIGISFGILSAMYRNSLLDYFVRIFAVLGTSIPEFFLLSLLIIIPSYLWQYSQPVGGYVALLEDPWTNLPSLPAAVADPRHRRLAGLMRLVRTTMLEVLRADYVRTAHAKGLR